MRRLAVVATLATLFTVGAAVQAPPNFSGRWILEPDAPAAAAGGRGRGGPGTMGSGWGPDITIAQDQSTLTVEYAQYGRGDMQPPMKLQYSLNGVKNKHVLNVGRGPQEQITKGEWDGAKLVLTTTHVLTNPETGAPLGADIRQVLSLDSPSSLVIETTRSGVLGGKSSTTTTRYKKN